MSSEYSADEDCWTQTGGCCAEKNCRTETTEGYCDLHRCATPGCYSAREASQYCISHVPCTKTGCSDFQCIYDERYRTRPLCITHWYTCRDPYCMWKELSATLRYCFQHKCRLGGCEERIAREGGIHCPRHTCGTGYPDNIPTLCGSGADANAGRPYCTSCTCIVPSCTAQRDLSMSVKSRGCKSHRCRSPGCDEVREDNAAHCIEHLLCNFLGCGTKRPVGAMYCAEHKSYSYVGGENIQQLMLNSWQWVDIT